jgi:hypothetical protein
MTSPRRNARRNLIVFWLVVAGIPALVIGGCVALTAMNPPRR